jgi:hypothetical protein
VLCSFGRIGTYHRIFSGVRNGRYGNLTDLGADVASRSVAWTEITRVFSDLARDVAKELKPGTEWQIEFLDASKRPLFRVRLVAEIVRIGEDDLPSVPAI